MRRVIPEVPVFTNRLALAKLVGRANCVPLLGGGDPAQIRYSNDIKGKQNIRL